MNKITHKERTEKNNIVCPNCHINIKVLTDDLFLNIGDEWHDDMYISHEDEYLERKTLQQRIDKAIEYIEKSMNNPQPFYKYLFGDENGEVQNLDKLLNILRGENIVNAEDNEKVKFWLEGCDIQFLAQAPEDITLKQLLKQCNRIIPDWCSCGINNKDIRDYQEVEIDIDYDDIKKMSEDVSCTIEEIDDNE